MLRQGIKEFILTGKSAEKENMLISATDNYFKALIHAVDYFLQQSIRKIQIVTQRDLGF